MMKPLSYLFARSRYELRARSIFASVIVLTAITHARVARADEPSAAETLFNEGRTALAAQQYDVACAKFRESDRLDPAVGTHLNLANCEEKRGHVATARTLFQEALGELAPEDPRSVVAKERIVALDGRIARLNIHSRVPLPPGTSLSIAGSTFDPATTRMPLMLDPGTYELRVSVPKHRLAMYSIELRDGQNVDFVIPDVGDNAKSLSPHEVESASGSDHSWNALQWTGAGSIAGGAVALGLGTYFAFAAASKNSDSSNDCTGDVCGPQGYTDRSAALSRGNAATAFAVVGTVLVGGGVTLLVVGRDGPDARSAAPTTKFALTAAPMGLGGQLVGRF